MKRPIFAHLSSLVGAAQHCEAMDNHVWEARHRATIKAMSAQFLPSGSGFDVGCQVDFVKSHAEKLIITTSYHQMNADGFYTGWIDCAIIVTPSLQSGIAIQVVGVRDALLREDMSNVFYDALTYQIDSSVVATYAPQGVAP